ncbi:MAG TPA: SCP2 sterol-binding domain-containing protein [Gaiellaceae bacterium]|nr:SCP2 sterol-binding domain-containing protein [Gaiellaceae bacterium]
MTTTTSDPTARFFAELAERGEEPLLRKASGAMRFDVVDGRKTRRWLLTVDKGTLAVTSSGGQEATCVVRADKAVFDRLASGRLNAVAALLRGDLAVAGDWRLLVRLQRLFPSPPRPRKPRKRAGA